MTHEQERTIWRIGVFFMWQDSAEARWLERMARDGWHLVAVKAYFLFKFAKGEPCEVRYHHDFMSETTPDYAVFCADAGWELVCTCHSWVYVRTRPGSEATVDFFTDAPSQIVKYQRVAQSSAIISAVVTLLTLALLYWMQGFSFLFGVVAATLAGLAATEYVLVQRKIERLRRKASV